MPAQRKPKPSRRSTAKRRGIAVEKPDSALQPIGKRKAKAKAKAKAEVVPARRIAGVGNAKSTVVDAGMVTLRSLAIGNGGAVIKVTEAQAACIRKLGDSL
jgi:hypothetical protein